MTGSLLNASTLAEWMDAIRLDFDSPSGFLYSLAAWLAQAPTGVVVTAAAATVALLALTRRPGTAALIVLAALAVFGVVGFAL